MPYPPRKTPSLTAPRARVTRARMFTKELQAELALGARPDLFRAAVVPEAAPDSYTLTAHLSPDLAIRWGLIASDALHNLRSALDEAFCQLIRLTDPRDNCKNRQFPIEYKQPQDIQKQLLKVPTAAAALIESLQPYHTGSEKEARRVPLRVLHDLNVWDKHRFLSIIMRQVHFPFAGFAADGQKITGGTCITVDGYTRDIIQEPDGWTTYRTTFNAPPGAVMGEPSMCLGWGWHWVGNPSLVEPTLLMLADEVERVLSLLEPVFMAEVARMRAEWESAGKTDMTSNEWREGLEVPA
jgi:hypothetical protein